MIYTSLKEETEAEFYYALEVLPPADMRSWKVEDNTRTVFAFLLGEPEYHRVEDGEVRAVYASHFSWDEDGETVYFAGPSMTRNTFRALAGLQPRELRAFSFTNGRATFDALTPAGHSY